MQNLDPNKTFLWEHDCQGLLYRGFPNTSIHHQDLQTHRQLKRVPCSGRQGKQLGQFFFKEHLTCDLGRIGLILTTVYTRQWSLKPTSTMPEPTIKAGIFVSMTSRQDDVFCDTLVGMFIKESKS